MEKMHHCATHREGAAPKEEEAPEGTTPEGDPSAQEEGDTAPAAAGAEDQRAAWEKQWESEVVVTNIEETTAWMIVRAIPDLARAVRSIARAVNILRALRCCCP